MYHERLKERFVEPLIKCIEVREFSKRIARRPVYAGFYFTRSGKLGVTVPESSETSRRSEGDSVQMVFVCHRTSLLKKN